jgi:hypothetical protein
MGEKILRGISKKDREMLIGTHRISLRRILLFLAREVIEK